MATNQPRVHGKNPTTLNAWRSLEQRALQARTSQLGDYFRANPSRSSQLTFQAAELSANLSRHFLDDTIMADLLALAEQSGLEPAIKRLFTGDQVNFTEGRPALHMALRGPCATQSQHQAAKDCRAKIQNIVSQIHSGEWRGHNNQPIKDVVNIGIGGSDLGPRMAVEALSPFHHPGIHVHFVANIDPSDLQQTLATLNPDTTLFIISSKSWATLETSTNALSARTWLQAAADPGSDLSSHFIAVSSRPDLCIEFGINPNNVLPMWDWVGGRFSLWSAIGLPIALAVGYDNFAQLLSGAQAMDEHFSSTPAQQNLPILLALLEVWYVNFWNCKSHAILPYSHHLRLLPDHLQQLIMESNGKQVDCNGNSIDYSTSPVIWGAAGTIGQHSFHQLLHQGTELIPADFVLPLLGSGDSSPDSDEQQLQLVANCLAQAQALMDGRQAGDIEETLLAEGADQVPAATLAAHKAIPGNRPCTLITMPRLTPSTLGNLIALYEHKVFSSSVIWNINAFDQWGVELGKAVSSGIYTALQGNPSNIDNPATAAAIADYLSTK